MELWWGEIMPAVMKQLPVREGRGKDAPIIGYVQAPQLQEIKTIDEMIAGLRIIIPANMSLDDALIAINNGFAIKSRQSLHNPESKVAKKVNSAVLEIVMGMIKEGHDLATILMAGKKYFTEEELTKLYNDGQEDEDTKI